MMSCYLRWKIHRFQSLQVSLGGTKRLLFHGGLMWLPCVWLVPASCRNSRPLPCPIVSGHTLSWPAALRDIKCSIVGSASASGLLDDGDSHSGLAGLMALGPRVRTPSYRGDSNLYGVAILQRRPHSRERTPTLQRGLRPTERTPSYRRDAILQ